MSYEGAGNRGSDRFRGKAKSKALSVLLAAVMVCGFIAVIGSDDAWGVDPYTLTLDPNGGTSAGSATVADGDLATIVSEPVRAGYSITGYLTSANGELVMRTTGYLVPNVAGFTDNAGNWIKGSDATLYAQWEPNIYNITLLANGGDTNGGATVEFGDNDLSLRYTPSRAGYRIAGFLTAPDGVLVYDWNTNMVPGVDGYTDESGRWIRAEDTTLYTQWVEDTFGAVDDGGDDDRIPPYIIAVLISAAIIGAAVTYVILKKGLKV